MHRTLRDEHFRHEACRTWFETIEEMRTALAAYGVNVYVDPLLREKHLGQHISGFRRDDGIEWGFSRERQIGTGR